MRLTAPRVSLGTSASTRGCASAKSIASPPPADDRAGPSPAISWVSLPSGVSRTSRSARDGDGCEHSRTSTGSAREYMATRSPW